MINELERKISTRDMRAGQGPVLLSRLGIRNTPNKSGLACPCDPRGDCTCRLAKPTITRDAKRPGIGHPHLIAAVLALRNISDRLDRVEQIHAANQAGMAQGQAPQDIINAAAAKAAQFQAENYARKVDEGILESHQKRADQAYRMAHGEPDAPGHAQPQQRPDIDNEAHKHNAPLDESSGDNRQATTKHPLGKSRKTGDASEYVTPEQARQMFVAHEREQAARRKAFEKEAKVNRNFRARDRLLMQDVKAQIERGNIERYGK